MAEKFTLIFKHERVTYNDYLIMDTESIEPPKYATVTTEDYITKDDINYLIDMLAEKIKEL